MEKFVSKTVFLYTLQICFLLIPCTVHCSGQDSVVSIVLKLQTV